PHLDDDRLELGESAVGQNMRTNQWKGKGPQLEVLQLRCLCLNSDTTPQVIRSLPLIWLRCMTRRVLGSNGSRRCSTERLFHISTSPTFHSWHIAKRGCVACAHSASSSPSLSASCIPGT